MSKKLKERIKSASAKEKRTMANWCAFHLERIIDEMDAMAASKTPALPTTTDLHALGAPERGRSARMKA